MAAIDVLLLNPLLYMINLRLLETIISFFISNFKGGIRMNTKKLNECKVIALAIQKGGVAKTTSSIAISSVLAEYGFKVLLIDNDPQHNSTRSLLGSKEVDCSISNVMEDMMNFVNPKPNMGIIHTNENFDILPASDSYAGIELRMISIMIREYFLKKYIEQIREFYDYIIIDCPPNLGMLTVNALVAADELLIQHNLKIIRQQPFNKF